MRPPINEHDEFLLSRLLDNDLSPAEAEVLRRRIEDEPALSEAYAAWLGWTGLLKGRRADQPQVDWKAFHAHVTDQVERAAEAKAAPVTFRLSRWLSGRSAPGRRRGDRHWSSCCDRQLSKPTGPVDPGCRTRRWPPPRPETWRWPSGNRPLTRRRTRARSRSTSSGRNNWPRQPGRPMPSQRRSLSGRWPSRRQAAPSRDIDRSMGRRIPAHSRTRPVPIRDRG